MLTVAYIEALLIDAEMADLVWEAWDQGEIDNVQSSFAWLIITVGFEPNLRSMDNIPTVN